MPGHVIGGPTAWTRDQLQARRDWIFDLGEGAVNQLRGIASQALAGNSLQELQAREVLTGPLEGVLVALQEQLLLGTGVAWVRGIPAVDAVDGLGAAMFWCLGRGLGRAVPQNAQGDLLGHVMDLGRDPTDPTTRLYQTHERQGWHTDSADVAGLMCVRPAARGGSTAIASASAVHDRLLRVDPESLKVLFEDFYTDHRGEHQPGAPEAFQAPVFSWFEGLLSVMYQRRYIESAQRLPWVPRLDSRRLRALDALDVAADDPALHLRIRLEPGEVLLMHNHSTLHDRSAFEDDNGSAGRHLLRLWICPPGGRALPVWFARRLRSLTPGDRGGVSPLSGTAALDLRRTPTT